MMHLEWPWMILALPLPILIRYLMPTVNIQQSAAIRVPFFDNLNQYGNNKHDHDNKAWLITLAGLAWVLLIIASTRPQWINERINIPINGRDLMLAIDLSGSMRTVDFKLQSSTINRLQAVKHVAGEFIQQRKGDRLGLILFGKKPYLQTPLTFDITTVNTQLQESIIGIAGRSTAIGDAIILAIQHLREKQQDSRVLILLTDGENTSGIVPPLRAAQLAASQKIKIYTIGIGADLIVSPNVFPARTKKNVAIDEKTLTTIANTTGGQYFRAHDSEKLKTIYQLIDQLEPIELEQQSVRPITALFYWPLACALIISFIVALLRIRPLYV